MQRLFDEDLMSINMNEKADTVKALLEKFKSLHNNPGLLYKRFEKYHAHICATDDELQAIYKLVNSHAHYLRSKTVLRFEKSSQEETKCLTDFLSIKCSVPTEENVNKMVKIVQEMPKEWTVVQLTSRYNSLEALNIKNQHFETNGIHISVFNCGQNEIIPFCMTVDAPRDSVNGNKVELANEIISIIADNKDSLITFPRKQKNFVNLNEKSKYYNKRQEIEERLELFIKDVQNMWLKEWRCLLSGKYVDDQLELKIRRKIEKYFLTHKSGFQTSQRILNLLCYITKAAPYLKLIELKSAVKYSLQNCEDKGLIKELSLFLVDLCSKLSLNTQKKHPLILVIDDELDCIPWEMIDILQNHPVTRTPSLYILYTLYKIHQDNVRDGHLIITRCDQGSYVINPGADLRDMEVRMTQFLEYWLPKWSGVHGFKPDEDEFLELLTSSEIFLYSGHGSGAHLLSSDKVQKTNVKAVVLLFGCGSIKTSRLGPQVEMFSTYHSYLIAKCPCVVGMLWEVTDIDTDTLTAEFMSQWLPSEAPVHWKFVDKNKWKKAEETLVWPQGKGNEETKIHEPELLRALISAKKCSKYLGTKAACVARGLPVKIIP